MLTSFTIAVLALSMAFGAWASATAIPTVPGASPTATPWVDDIGGGGPA